MREGAKDTAVAFGTRLAVLCLGVAIQSTLAWLLGPGGRGSYAVCLLFATLLATAFTFGTDRAGQYFAASRGMSPEDAVWATIAAALVGSVLAILVGRVLMALDLSFFEKAQRSSFFISFAIMPFSAVGNALAMLLVALRRFRWFAIVSIVNSATQLVASLVLIAGLRLDVNGALLAVVLAGAASSAASLEYLRRAGGLSRTRLRWSHFARLLSYGLRYYVARLSNMVHFRAGTILLSFFAVPTDIGFFAAASGLVSRIFMVPDAIETALLSRVAGDPRGRPELVARAARVSALVCGCALAALVALSRPVVAVFLSSEFLPSVSLIWILTPGVFARCASKVLMSYFMGTDRPAICSWAVGFGAIVNFVSLIALFPVLGLPGAGLAMTLGYVTSSVILVTAFGRTARMPLCEVWLLKREDLTLLWDLARSLAHRRA